MQLYNIPFVKMNGRRDNWNTRDKTVTHCVVMIDVHGSHFLLWGFHSYEAAVRHLNSVSCEVGMKRWHGVAGYVLERAEGPLSTRD